MSEPRPTAASVRRMARQRPALGSWIIAKVRGIQSAEGTRMSA
jgi:hypothetical protein